MKKSASEQAKAHAKELRRHMPQAEIMLWSRLKTLRAEGIRFRRQHAIENFVVDFACIKAMVAIEVDGQSHDDERHPYDASRQDRLEELGWLVLRYPNLDVMRHTDSVIQNVFECVQSRLPILDGSTPP